MNDACVALDPRMHFALNCGAKSCPPARKFAKGSVNGELHVVSLACCSDEVTKVKFSLWDDKDNTETENKKAALCLNQTFNWCGADFGSTNKEIGTTVAQWLTGDKKEVLEKHLNNNDNDLELEFLPCDWTSDALDPMPFNREEF